MLSHLRATIADQWSDDAKTTRVPDEFYSPSNAVRCLLQVWQSSECLVNVCSSLDWKRCVAVHLWYMLPPTASVADALAKYQDAFQVGAPPGSLYIYILRLSSD